MGIVLESLSRPLTPSQRQAAEVIEREFRAAGFSPEIAAAALVNAWAESKLNPLAQSKPPEDSAGLFQLNRKGAGWDMPTGSQYPRGDSRFDPRLNVRRFVREITHTTPGKRFVQEAKAVGQDVAVLAGLLCYHVERPKDREGKALERAELARELFPRGIVRSAPLTVPVASRAPQAAPVNPWPWVGAITAVSCIGLAAAGDWYRTWRDG